MTIFGLLAFAVITERVVQLFKDSYNEEIPLAKIGSMILGVILSIAYELDLMQLIGFSDNVRIIGCVLTGILISGGSNYVADLVQTLENIMKPTKEE